MKNEKSKTRRLLAIKKLIAIFMFSSLFFLLSSFFLVSCENPFMKPLFERFEAAEETPDENNDLIGITAYYVQSQKVYPATPLEYLKSDLTVIAHYPDNTYEVLGEDDYSLSGYLTIGESVITVTFFEYTDYFTVIVTEAPEYGIDVYPYSTYTFENAEEGYSVPPSLTVIVTNVGTSAIGNLNVVLSGVNAGSFTLSVSAIASIVSGSHDIFAVSPNSGLSAGTYSATVTVSNADVTESFTVSFTVLAKVPQAITPSTYNSYYFEIAKEIVTTDGTYFANNGGAAGTHIYEWKRSDNSDRTGNVTTIATTKNYTPQGADFGKYIWIETTPVGDGSMTGIPAISTAHRVGIWLIATADPFAGNPVTINDATPPVFIFGAASVAVAKAYSSDTVVWTANPDVGSFTNATADSTTYTPPVNPSVGTITLTVTLTAPLGSAGNPITSNAQLNTFLTEQPINTAATPYTVYVNVNNLTGFGTTLINNSDKFINLNLSGSTLTTIPLHTFENCHNLVGITIPNGVASIENNAFSNCSNLSNVTLPDSVISLGVGAFYWCVALQSITLPSNLNSIGMDAFQATGLTSVIIPASVTSIGQEAFGLCDNLASVTFQGDTIGAGNAGFAVSSGSVFGNLRSAYIQPPPAGGAGTYTTTTPWGGWMTTTWTKQP